MTRELNVKQILHTMNCPWFGKKKKKRADMESAAAKLNQRAKCRQRLDTVVMSNQTFYPRGCRDLEDGGTTWKN